MNKLIKERILEVLRDLEAQKEILQLNYSNQLSAIEKEIKLVQKQCDHNEKTYYPDPSGNNDSFYECEICGKSAKRL